MNRETLSACAAEIRFAENAEASFSGYAAIFNEPDSYGDTIRAGAFRNTLKKRAAPPSMFWNHNSDRPIGVWTSLVEDAKGLKVEGRLITETAAGAEAYALLKAGAVSGLSIGFRSRSSERGANGSRILTQIELVEVSLVSLPAASKARVTNVKNTGASGLAALSEAVRRAAHTIRG
ncbi:MAG: HK97 family phage prohead protease [Beijerinckiaceae bacterium]